MILKDDSGVRTEERSVQIEPGQRLVGDSGKVRAPWCSERPSQEGKLSPGAPNDPVPFGKYYLLGLIARGGMAEVYRARAAERRRSGCSRSR